MDICFFTIPRVVLPKFSRNYSRVSRPTNSSLFSRARAQNLATFRCSIPISGSKARDAVQYKRFLSRTRHLAFRTTLISLHLWLVLRAGLPCYKGNATLAYPVLVSPTEGDVHSNSRNTAIGQSPSLTNLRGTNGRWQSLTDTPCLALPLQIRFPRIFC